MALLDELQGGGPVVASADLEGELGVSTGVLATALFTVPMVVAVVLEPLVLLRTERWDRRRVVAGSLVAMALCQLAAVTAGGVAGLGLAVSAWGVAAGIATAAAEVALVAARPADVDRTMARWALLGSVGDLLAPALFAVAAWLGVPWRAAVVVGAGIALIDALAVVRGPPLGGEVDASDEPSLREALGEIARARGLWPWALAATACTLMDELLVSLGSVWMRADGVSPALQGASFVAFSVGGALALLVWERVRAGRVEDRLLLCCGASVPVLVGWLGADGPALLGWGFLLGAAVVPMWPAATARAYARGGAHPARVAALLSLLAPVEVLAPAALGGIADHAGLLAALLALLLQPLVVGLVAGVSRGPPSEATL